MILKKSILLIALLISFTAFAQTKDQAINLLNTKAKETINNIKIVNSDKYEIKEASVTVSDEGIVYNVKFSGKTTTSYRYEFDPSDISSIEDLYIDKESPIGTLKITMKDYVTRYNSGTKKADENEKFVDYVNIQYLKIDENNYSDLKKSLLRLKELYTQAAPAAVTNFVKKMSNTSFWFGGDGASRTYKLKRIYYTGCLLKIFYDLKEISPKGTSDYTRMVVIPLKDIDDIKLEKTKSKPNCIMLLHGGKGFETYAYYDTKEYKPDPKQKEIPSFIDATKQEDLIVAEQFIKDAVKTCGGGKVKL